MIDWSTVFELAGAALALIAIGYSLYIMAKVRRGAPVWIYLGITSFCMFFAMLLGLVDMIFPVDPTVQRIEQYMLILAGAVAFALSGIKLHEIMTYKE
ncbi:MAG: hypothetical protein QXN62_07720 [Candidatus Bathyarchaeia archaeon]|nr:hypothetical protein [Candidatus Bathyarchaeota archaeon]